MTTPRVPRMLPPRLTRPTGIAPAATSKIGPVAAPNPAVATASSPQTEQGRAEARTYVQTYFTKVLQETQVLYNGDRQWAKITMTLETAGPVAIGTVQKITPVLSGKGILLVTNEPMSIVIAKGTRLFVASTAVNRVRVQVEPLPWLEQITATLRSLVGKLGVKL